MPYSLVPALIVAPIVAAGVSVVPATEVETIMYRFFVSLASIAVLIIGYLAARTLRQIDINQSELFHKINIISDSHHELKGAHDMRVFMSKTDNTGK